MSLRMRLYFYSRIKQNNVSLLASQVNAGTTGYRSPPHASMAVQFSLAPTILPRVSQRVSEITTARESTGLEAQQLVNGVGYSDPERDRESRLPASRTTASPGTAQVSRRYGFLHLYIYCNIAHRTQNNSRNNHSSVTAILRQGS